MYLFQDMLRYCSSANNIAWAGTTALCHTGPWCVDYGQAFLSPVSVFLPRLLFFPVFTACSCPAMAQQDGAAGKRPAAAALHSRFMVGSVSEENSEDETQGKADLQLEEKENRSVSPSSCSSDSAYETGFDQVDGTAHNLRLDIKRLFLFPSLCTNDNNILYTEPFVTFSVFFWWVNYFSILMSKFSFSVHHISLQTCWKLPSQDARSFISVRSCQSLKSWFRNSKSWH